MSLNEMLEARPALKESIPEYLWTAATVGGDIYAVPNVQMEFTQTSLCVLKSLADKYNLDTESIKKVEDIEPFLEQVKQGEPVYTRLKSGFRWLTNPVMEKILDTEIAVRKDTGEVVCLLRTTGISASAQKIHDWYQRDMSAAISPA